MASSRKAVGKIKLPAAFAQMGLQIDPQRLKPGAWQNRDKRILKTSTSSPAIMESRQEPIHDLQVEAAEICYAKPSISKGLRRKRSNKRARIPILTDDTNHFMKKPSISIPPSFLNSTENNNDTETSADDHDDNNNNNKQNNRQNEEIISSQFVFIEQLQTEKLRLEEWKTDVGETALKTVSKLENHISEIQNEAQQYQLDISGLQTRNDALKQQITAYQDEIEKLEKEKIGKLQTQITDLEQMLSEHNLMQQQLHTKEEELRLIKIDFESTKSCILHTEAEVKLLRKENDEIKRENEQYLELLDVLKEQEVKLKKQVHDQQLEITDIAAKYTEIESQLTKETVETRLQLQDATHFANNLSDQLEEIHNYNFRKKENNQTDSDCGDGFGRPLFEKRKTLKILTYEQSLKLPNMMEMIDMIQNENEYDVDDEFMDNVSKIPQMDKDKDKEPPSFAASLKGKSLPPVNEFDVNDDRINEFEDEEDDKSTDQRQRTASTSSTATYEGADNQSSFAHYICNNMENYKSNTSENGEEKIDKLLRKISGSSYHKFRRGSNGMALDVETRNRLKNEIVAYIESMNMEFQRETEQKDAIIIRFKEESQQWEDKYKTLKREIKKKKLTNAQHIQKQQEPIEGGCNFWNWGSGFSQKWFDLQKGWSYDGGNNMNSSRIFVADDSDDTDSNPN